MQLGLFELKAARVSLWYTAENTRGFLYRVFRHLWPFAKSDKF